MLKCGLHISIEVLLHVCLVAVGLSLRVLRVVAREHFCLAASIFLLYECGILSSGIGDGGRVSYPRR